MGYVLPWGQMSYWGAQVIVSLFGAIPYVGEDLVQWIRGDYLISGITLNRFFSLHVIALPIVILALVVLHILALHEVGSNNPDGVDIKKNKDENGIPKDGIPFHPYYTVHDLMGITVFLFVFCFVLFFMPEMGGFFLEYANFEAANNLKTPEHIAPVWYFTPFYAILRAVTIDLGGVFTAKLLGFMAMGAAIAILFVLPWLDKSPVRSIRYKGWLPKIMLLLFASTFVVLGYLGVKAPTDGRTVLSQLGTVFYFVFFLTMPVWSNPENPKVKSILNWIICIALGVMLLNISFSAMDKEVPVFIRIFGVALAVLTILLPVLTAKDTVGKEPTRTQAKGLPLGIVLLGLLFFVVMTVLPIKAVAAGGAFDCGSIPCDTHDTNLKDKESLQSGAKWFMNYCLACHSAQYSRYERVANDLGIPHDVMKDNLIFGDEKIGSLMEISMNPADSKVWFGASPPDLTLVARVRSPDWLYTYLRNFYSDPSRPLGVNNRVFANVGMPHAMLELQGLLDCGPGPKLDSYGNTERNALGEAVTDEKCGALVEGSIEGSMSAEEFDKVVYDLVNFIEYLGEPIAEERKRLGVFVLLFLVVLFVFTFLLNREYWKGIH